METITKRAKQPPLSEAGEQVIVQYERRLRTEEDLAFATIRHYLSDLRHFAAWCESFWKDGREVYFGTAGYADREARKPMRRDTLVQMSHPRRKGHENFPSEVMDPVKTRSKEAKRNVPTALRGAADAESRKAKARADAAPADGEPCPPEGEDFAKTPAHGGALLAVS